MTKPSSHPFLLNVAEWLGLSGVRFYVESEDRVPHDSMIGLDRAACLLERMLGETAPFTPDEESALLLLGKVQAKSGRHLQAIETYQSALLRRLTPAQRIDAFRGVGTSHIHLGNYPAAGKSILNALQIRVDPFSQWLFKVVLDRLGSLPVDFPPELLFPLRSEPADRLNPPLLEFTDVAASLGVNRRDGHGTCAWGDYDGDGDLDLLLGGRDTFVALYRNDGRRFVEVTDRAGLSGVPSGYSLNFVDYDNDGYPDILATSLGTWPAVLAGLQRSYSVPNLEAVDRNAPRLFRNNRDGTFTDATWEARLYYPVGSMGAGMADVDNDGYMDIFFGTGDPQLSRLEPNRFFRNNGDGTFSDLTMTSGLGHIGKGHGVTFIDYDGDGDLDIYAQIGAADPGDMWENAFYRNEKGNRNHWLQVDLAGTRSNRHGVGAVLVARAGGLIVHREVKGSEGFGSTNPYRVSFGLGSRTRVESLEVNWPSGEKQTPHDLPADRVIAVTEGE